uniref:Uncharacterized protein n=1 Tax=Triticum urartu TaxID=4572 RepID=A0A8R7QYA4_TRIUA
MVLMSFCAKHASCISKTLSILKSGEQSEGAGFMCLSPNTVNDRTWFQSKPLFGHKLPWYATWRKLFPIVPLTLSHVEHAKFSSLEIETMTSRTIS